MLGCDAASGAVASTFPQLSATSASTPLHSHRRCPFFSMSALNNTHVSTKPTNIHCSRSILNVYFASVVPLIDYLVDILDSPSRVTSQAISTRDYLLFGSPDATYTSVLTRSLVAAGDGSAQPHPRFVVCVPLETMAEVRPLRVGAGQPIGQRYASFR